MRLDIPDFLDLLSRHADAIELAYNGTLWDNDEGVEELKAAGVIERGRDGWCLAPRLRTMLNQIRASELAERRR